MQGLVEGQFCSFREFRTLFLAASGQVEAFLEHRHLASRVTLGPRKGLKSSKQLALQGFPYHLVPLPIA